MGRQKYTIRDIAREAGISIATVSRYMNRSGYVDAATAEKIEEVVKRLGYVPSRMAQALKTKKSRQLMLIVPDIGNPFYSGLARSVQASAKDKGYAVTLYNTSEDPGEELFAVEMAGQILSDGIILCSVHTASQVVEALKTLSVPVVLANSYEHACFDTVHGIRGQGTYLSTMHLLNSGHRLIGFAGGPGDSGIASRRKYGFLKALDEQNCSFSEDYCFEMGFSMQAGYKAGRYFSSLSPRPTAICCANDLIAFGILASFNEMGINVPDEISLTGMDDIPFAELTRPRLTTVTNDSGDYGKSVASLLFDRLEGAYTGPPREVVIPRRLIVRDSVKQL